MKRRGPFDEQDKAEWLSLCNMITGKAGAAKIHAKINRMKKITAYPADVYRLIRAEPLARRDNPYCQLLAWGAVIDAKGANRARAIEHALAVRADLEKRLIYRAPYRDE